MQSFLTYLAKATGFVLLLRAASALLPHADAVGAILIVLLVAVPAVAAASYEHALRRTLLLGALRPGGRLRLLLSGSALRLLMVLPLALWSAASILFAIAAGNGALWLGLLALGCLVGLCYRALAARIEAEVLPCFRFLFAGRLALPLATGIGAAACLLVFFNNGGEGFSSLREAIGAQPRYSGSSALMAAIFEGFAVIHGLGAYAASAGFGPGSMAAAGAYVLSLVATVQGLAKAFSAFVPPLREFGRVLAPPVALERPPLPSRRRLLLATLASAAGIVFVCLPLAAVLERKLAPYTPNQELAAAGPLQRPRLVLERIDDVLVRSGTIAQLAAMRDQAAARLAARRTELAPLAHAAFDAMRANVPVFLDGYYGLAGEYTRLGKLVLGHYETYVEEELRRQLGAGDPFGAFDRELAVLKAQAEAELAAFRLAAASLIHENSVTPVEGAEPAIAGSTTGTVLLDLPSFGETIGFTTRLKAAALAGSAAGLSGFVVGRSVGKMAAGGLIGLSGRALAKLATGRLASRSAAMVAGGIAGGSAGSVVPGAGTGVGALIGAAIAGLTFGVGTDYLLLKLEEQLSRADFQRDIMASIDAYEADFLESFNVAPSGTARAR